MARPEAVPHPVISVGGFPTGISLDPTTDTIYVGNGTADDVSLINGGTCDGSNMTGCAQTAVAVTAGADPIGSVEDPTTKTLYVVNSAGSVAVINDRTCDAANTTGCSTTPVGLIHVGTNSEFAALDPLTHTLYVANLGSGTVSVVNLRHCSSITTAGCSHAVVRNLHSGPDPFAITVDTVTNTVYVTNDGSDTVTVIDGRTCNSTVFSGCAASKTEYVGYEPGGITVDQATNTVYVADQESDAVSMFSGAQCDSLHTTRCGQVAYRLNAGNGDRGIAVDPLTDTVYVANTNANSVLVFSGRACNGAVHTGCAHHAFARVGSSPRRIVVDPTTDTIYVTNAYGDTVSMINGRTCNGSVITGC